MRINGRGTRTLAVLFAILGGSSLPAAQQPTPPPPPERGAHLLAVDFAVVSTDGRPVADLKASDVSIRIGGRRRTVRSLQLIAAGGGNAGEIKKASLPEPFGTNAESDTGRTLVLAIDDDSFKTGRETVLRDAVDGLIARLAAQDRLSLVTMPYGGVKVPPTTDHARVKTALLRIIGQASGEETGSDLACRSRRTLESLAGYLDERGIRETPMTVMFITGGLAAPRRDAPVSMAPGMCELRTEVYRYVGEAAGAARAQFYVIQPGELSVRPQLIQREDIAGSNYRGSDNPLEGIEHLAGVTGGKMLQLTGSPEGAFGRVLNETSAYYLAAIDPDGNDRSGRSQQLEVRLSRPGTELRSRPHITFAKPDRVAPRPLNPSPRDMLSVATVFRDLPLRASAFTALEADGKTLRVVTLAEPVDPQVKFSTMVAALFDRDGKSVSHWSATAEELQRSPVIGAMAASPGAYRLRVAAIDTTGRSGTADYDLEAEVVQTGVLRLSSVILGLSREGRFLPRLQFGAEPVAIAYIEMYGAAPGTRISSSLELATTLNGPALVTLPLAIEAAGPNRYVATGAVPIGALSPGDYIVRAMAGIEGQPLTRVVRTLRKVAK